MKVVVPPGGSVTAALMSPVPVGTSEQLPPPVPEQLHATPVIAAGIVSATIAPTAVLGPAFATATE